MHSPVTPLIIMERLQRGEIEPAAATLAPSHRTKLATFVEHLVAGCALGLDVEFGREGAAANPSAVGLGDAQHVMQQPGPTPAPAAPAPATQLLEVTKG